MADRKANSVIAQLDRDYIRTRSTKAINRTISHLLLQGRPLTTTMRWLNPLLFAQYAIAKRLPPLRRVTQPIFILGTGRSGTTILGKVMSMHRRITFLNEPKSLWHAAYSYEDVIGSYSMGEAHYSLDASHADGAVIRAMQRLYSYVLLITGGGRVLDKYPEMIFRIPFVRAIFPDAKFIFLVRNGYDTAQSITTWSKQNNMPTYENWWGRHDRKWKLLVRDIVSRDDALADRVTTIADFERHEDRAAVEWTVTMRTGLRLQAESPDLLYPVRYETLCREPDQTLRQITAFCELPEDEVFLSYAKRTLASLPARQPFELHSAIEDVFLDTMHRLDYAGQSSPAQTSA